MNYNDYMEAMQRDNGSISNEELVIAYEKGLHDLNSALVGMTPEETRLRPIQGKWSTLEVLCHITDTEIYFSDRLQRTIALDRPLLVGVDERPYAEKLNYQELEFADVFNLFIALRRHMLGILKLQPKEVWNRTAIHTETGLVTLRQLMFHAIGHVNHHLWFIEEKREAMKKSFC